MLSKHGWATLAPMRLFRYPGPMKWRLRPALPSRPRMRDSAPRHGSGCSMIGAGATIGGAGRLNAWPAGSVFIGGVTDTAAITPPLGGTPISTGVQDRIDK